ncbi:MAG: TonB-dependent receptor, partial [Candidatus Promineofilum sp.]|nr:TonB-dependent receptor [Promineifilum sp.]
DIALDFDPTNDRESYGFSARAEFDLGGAVLKSISAYRHSDYAVKAGGEGTSATLAITHYFEKARQYSQELQISGMAGQLQYIIGAYYFDEKTTGGTLLPFSLALVGGPNDFVQGFNPNGTLYRKAAAGFGQLDYDVSDQLTLTVGARYSWERHRADDRLAFDLVTPYPPRIDVSEPINHIDGDVTTDKAFTPKFQVAYKPRPELMFYASASKGFKSGGFDIGSTAPAFKPETLWAYEGGMKGTFADGRVRINAAGFYYDYTNIQVSQALFNMVQILNAASAVVYGAEAELTVVPVDGLQFDATPAWLHTEYKGFESANPSDPFNTSPIDLTGNHLIQAPEISLKLGAQYGWTMADGKMTLRGDITYQDRVYFTPFNENQVSRKPNTKFNAFLNYEGEHWTASLYVLNLTNKTTIANALASGILFGAPVLGTLEPPRTYGIKVGYHF